MRKLAVVGLLSLMLFGGVVNAAEIDDSQVYIGSVGESLIGRTFAGVEGSGFAGFNVSQHEYTQLCNMVDFVNASFGKPDYVLVQDLHESQYVRAYKAYALYQFGSEFVCVDVQECLRIVPDEDDILQVMHVGLINPQVTLTANHSNIMDFISDKQICGYVLVDDINSLRVMVGSVN